MRAPARFFTIVLSALAMVFGAHEFQTWNSGSFQPTGDEAWAAESASRLVAWIETEYASEDAYTKTPIRLGYSRAFSKHFTKANGKVEINFETGRITVSVEGLDPNPKDTVYEVWFVEDGARPSNTAAIDFGTDGDRILRVGTLPESGALVTSLDPRQLADFEVQLAAVMRVSQGREPEFVIGGMQSIRYLMGREAKRKKPTGALATAGFRLTPALAAAQNNSSKKATLLVAQGRDCS